MIPRPGSVETFDAHYCPRCQRDLTDPCDSDRSCALCRPVGFLPGREHLIPAKFGEHIRGERAIARLASYVAPHGSRLWRRLVYRWTARLAGEGLL